MTERRIETESLTKSIYYLKMTIEYMEDFKRSCKHEAKQDAGRWADGLNKVLNSVYCSLTPESRERFKSEIAFGDVFYFPEMSNLLLQMTPDQRSFMETVAKTVLSGEKIVVEDTHGQKEEINT